MQTLIKNATIVTDGRKFIGNIFIVDDSIAQISESEIQVDTANTIVIDANRNLAIPGVIDEHVHFREPGLTHKADIYSESKAAIAGGVTSYMDMPNVKPQTSTRNLLNEKKQLAAEKSLANYSFYLGATNENIDEIKGIDTSTVCGVKLFMGSSTGNMLVDEQLKLEKIFAESPCLIAVHCEDEQTIKSNIEYFKEKLGDRITAAQHPLIRSTDACYKSTEKAIELATRFGSRLHVMHISTAKELDLFSSGDTKGKTITAETCPHYLIFSDDDYAKFGYRIKCNPAIKSESDRLALTEALNSGKIDTIGTDHAPHLPSEKFGDTYFTSASGMPTIQHSLLAMIDLCKKGKLRIEDLVQKMCHAPADIYGITKRGYIRAGYKADIAIIDTNKPQVVTPQSLLYKCGWSPFDGLTFGSTVTHTFVNGNLVYQNGSFNEDFKGEALHFDR